MRLIQIVEGFDSAVPFKELTNDSYDFEVGGKGYLVDFIPKTIGKINKTSVDFSTYDDEGDITYSIIGTGNARTVLATVMAAIKEYMKNKRIHMIDFTADEPSRRSLYRVMAKRLGKSDFWTFEPADGEFILVNKHLVPQYAKATRILAIYPGLGSTMAGANASSLPSTPRKRPLPTGHSIPL